MMKDVEKQKQKTAIVVGAGVGGIATAARLAKAGYKVTVVEKNDYTGGRCSLLHQDGYRFDQGPSLLLLPGLFEECFNDLGTSMSAEGIRLKKCDPNYNVWFHDNASFRLSTDLASMKGEVEKWEGKSGFSRYLAFLRESHTHYEASVVHVLHRNFTSFLSMLRPGFLRYLLALHPFESIYSRASRYFDTERLRMVFTFGSMYMGMSPYDAPGTYSLLQYTELAEGIWYPEGGFNKVPSAIEAVSRRMGVEYLMSTSVQSIDTAPSTNTATGITLSDGTHLPADLVVCNADLVYAYKNLLPPSISATALDARHASCSSISFYWSLNQKIPQLTAHNIFLAREYRSSFDSIFKDQQLPNEPSFYVNVPSRVDPTAAPPDCDAVVILCPVGHLISNAEAPLSGGKGLNPQNQQDWDALVNRARSAVLDTIETRLRIDFRSHIVHERLNTPATWRDEFNLDKGAILGLSHSFFNVLSFRPSTKHESIKGLYFVGASTHPGTGVPIVLAGSKVTSEQILADAGVEQPWPKWRDEVYEGGVSRLAEKGSIDSKRWRPVASWFDLVVAILVSLVALGLLVVGNLVLGRESLQVLPLPGFSGLPRIE